MRSTITKLCLVGLLSTIGFGCSSVDYTEMENYYKTAPKSVIVLPVLNESTEAEAGRFFLSTIAKPLAARGYYVLPVEITKEILALDGVEDGGSARQVEPQLLAQYFGADAVLYVTITEWDTSYIVVASSVTVAMHYKLVDCETGNTVWERSARQTVSSDSHVQGGGLGGLIAALIVSTVDAAVTAAATDYVPLASQANYQAFSQLPVGVYHPQYAETQATIAAWRAKQPPEAPSEQ